MIAPPDVFALYTAFTCRDSAIYEHSFMLIITCTAALLTQIGKPELPGSQVR